MDVSHQPVVNFVMVAMARRCGEKSKECLKMCIINSKMLGSRLRTEKVVPSCVCCVVFFMFKMTGLVVKCSKSMKHHETRTFCVK